MSLNLDSLETANSVGELVNSKNKLEEYENELVGLMAVIHGTKSSIEKIKTNLAERERKDAEQRYQEYEEISREYFDIKDKLDSFPEMIKDQKDHISGLRELVEQAEGEVDLIESTMMMGINSETDENDKKKFSNKGMRQAELKRRKLEDEEYLAAKEELKDAERNLEQAELELDKYYNQFKSTRRVAEMLRARMEMLA